MPERKQDAGEGGVDWEALARARVHWLQVSILEILSIDGGRALSPTEMAFELQEQMTVVIYHVRELHKFDLLRLSRRVSRRSALESYYVATTPWDREHG